MSKNFLQEGFVLKGGQHQYRIVKVLGHGGFGITYLAQTRVTVGNISIMAQFAVKEHFLKADCERDASTSRVQCSGPAQERVDTSRKDFLAEARRLHKVGVTHPNIVKVNEVFEANNTAYYVMEFLDGVSLSDYVKRKGPLSESEALAIMRPIASAVAALHANHMTHLDIKPANIMLVNDDEGNLRPVLIDFGLSKHYDENGEPTSTINLQGFSDGYAPIEQYMGITTFSPRSDVYALGATLFFCLTGRKPGKPDELAPGELAASLPAGVSAATRSIVEQATRLVKSQRPEDVAALFGTATAPTDESEDTEIVVAPDANGDEDEATDLHIVNPHVVNPPVVNPPVVTPPVANTETKKSRTKLWIFVAAGVILFVIAGVIALLNFTGKSTEVDMPASEAVEDVSPTETKELNEQAIANLKAGNEAAQRAASAYGYRTTPSGLVYNVSNGKPLNPPRNMDNLNVTVDYTIKKLDGTTIDSGENVVLPVDALMPGFREALSLIEMENWAFFYIPGELAYGEKGLPQAGVGPMEMLTFEVKLKDYAYNK